MFWQDRNTSAVDFPFFFLFCSWGGDSNEVHVENRDRSDQVRLTRRFLELRWVESTLECHSACWALLAFQSSWLVFWNWMGVSTKRYWLLCRYIGLAVDLRFLDMLVFRLVSSFFNFFFFFWAKLIIMRFSLRFAVVRCRRQFIDFEGRSDGESIKHILGRIKPRQLVSACLQSAVSSYASSVYALRHVSQWIVPFTLVKLWWSWRLSLLSLSLSHSLYLAIIHLHTMTSTHLSSSAPFSDFGPWIRRSDSALARVLPAE